MAKGNYTSKAAQNVAQIAEGKLQDTLFIAKYEKNALGGLVRAHFAKFLFLYQLNFTRGWSSVLFSSRETRPPILIILFARI